MLGYKIISALLILGYEDGDILFIIIFHQNYIDKAINYFE
jgi:hypothetical protein